VRGKRVNAKRIARAVADAQEVGAANAAAKHGLSQRSIERYSAKLKRKVAAAGGEKRPMLAVFDEFLREAVEALREKLAEADAYQTAGAIKIVGDLRIGEVALEAGGMVKHGERPVGAIAQGRTIDVPCLPMAAADSADGDARH
jgi:hypothetical protein